MLALGHRTIVVRQADFIEQSLGNLFKAFLEGASITLLALPLSLVAAVFAMDRVGLTLNSMSLGGLAIAIRELVDDAARPPSTWWSCPCCTNGSGGR